MTLNCETCTIHFDADCIYTHVYSVPSAKRNLLHKELVRNLSEARMALKLGLDLGECFQQFFIMRATGHAGGITG